MEDRLIDLTPSLKKASQIVMGRSQVTKVSVNLP